MAFPATTTYKLVFDNDDLEGLVVKVRSASIRLRNEYQTLETDEEIIEWFPKILVEWNIVDDETKEPVPCTADGIRAIDWDVFNGILAAWQTARRVTPPAPLELPSDDGDPSVVASIPMEVESASQAS